MDVMYNDMGNGMNNAAPQARGFLRGPFDKAFNVVGNLGNGIRRGAQNFSRPLGMAGGAIGGGIMGGLPGAVAGAQLGGNLGGGLQDMLNNLYPQQAAMGEIPEDIQQGNNEQLQYLLNQLQNPQAMQGQQQQAMQGQQGMAMQGQQMPPLDDFEGIANRTRQDFNNRTIPDIMTRFAGLGAERSSGLQQALGGAATDLEGRLADMRGRYGLERERALQGREQLGQGRYQLGQRDTGLNLERLGALAGLQANQQRYGLERAGLGLQRADVGLRQRQQNQAEAYINPQNVQNMLGLLNNALQGENRFINEQDNNLLQNVVRYLNGLNPQQPPHLAVNQGEKGYRG